MNIHLRTLVKNCNLVCQTSRILPVFNHSYSTQFSQFLDGKLNTYLTSVKEGRLKKKQGNVTAKVLSPKNEKRRKTG
jgi:hypothetical protein